jgi:hypothetical protein
MEAIKGKIVSLYVEYKEFDSIVKAKNEKLAKTENNLKDIVSGKSVEELQQILVHVYVDTILYNKDLQLMFLKLVNAIELYKEFSKEDLPEDISTFYSEMKNWAPKRVFAVEKNDLVETETGLLEEERTKFLESDFFKSLLERTQQK